MTVAKNGAKPTGRKIPKGIGGWSDAEAHPQSPLVTGEAVKDTRTQ